MPKAKPFSESGANESDRDEEEKTTIESQWEEEASTTVEQGEVAEKIRALGVEPQQRTPQQQRSITNITSTGASQVDELTVDDGSVSPALSALGMPPANVARLVITQGNEAGQELEILPGKRYTIGRGIDNDVVLTDIAVSRKHFDLRNDDGSWVLVDHSSGNGTVVNGNIEDNPFMLANGDVIEIGNTSFRFELQNGPPRAQSFEVEVDDEELSTVAGKPLRTEQQPEPPRYERPKTLPPPAPLRPRSPSVQPYSPPLPPTLAPQPASTLPLPQQLSTRVPMLAPQAPTMLAMPPMDSQKYAPNNGGGIPGAMPSTIPGQVPQQVSPRPMFYPQASDVPPQSLGVHAHMLVMPQMQRGDGSTVHVPPTPYNGLPAAQPARYVQPQISKRTKYVLGGAALTLFAAISTVAIMQSGNKKQAGAAPVPKPHVEPIKQEPDPSTLPAPKPDPKTDTKPVVDAVSPPNKPDVSTKPDVARPQTIGKTDPPKPPPVVVREDPPKPPPVVVKNDPPKPPPVVVKNDPPKPPPVVVKNDPPKPPPVVVKNDPPKPPLVVVKNDPPKPPPVVVKNDPPKPPPVVVKNDPKPDPRARTPKRPSTAASASTPPKPRVAAAVADPAEAKSKADELYRNKKFNEAADVLKAAARSLSDSDGKLLRYTATSYEKLARAFSLGTAPATKPVDAYAALKQAEGFDRAVGGAFTKDIHDKLAQIAPKAAIGFMAAKEYENARVAVATAEGLGAANETTKVVKQTLDARAAELYQQAKDDPTGDGAKEKLRRILKMVDQKSVWYAKAQKLLQGG